MSALGDGANRSLSVIDCEDELTIAKFKTRGTPPGSKLNPVRLMRAAAMTTAAAKLVDSPVLGAAEHTLDEIA